MPVARLWSFNAKFLGLTVDALTTGALRVDGLVERTGAIQGDAHASAPLPVDVFDASFPFGKLKVLARLAGGFWMQKWAAKALGTIAIGMLKGIGGMHPQSFLPERDAIGSKRRFRMLVEWDGSYPSAMDDRLIDEPGIKGCIGSDMSRKLAEGHDGLLIERAKVG